MTDNSQNSQQQPVTWQITEDRGNGDWRITCPHCGQHGWTGEDVAWPTQGPSPVRHTNGCPWEGEQFNA